MSKPSFVVFAIVAVALAIAVPLWAFAKDGKPGSSPAAVAAEDEPAKELFQINCGACHMLAAAGTHGIVGPDLDDVITSEGQEERVLNAILNGVGGRMPADILRGPQAEEVAAWVGRAAAE